MADSLIMSVKCTNGVLNVFDDRIEISRKTFSGTVAQGIKGNRVLFYKDLSSIEYKKPSIWANGYIKFILPGNSEANAAVNFTGRTAQQSLQDPNTLILRAFGKKMPEESKKAYDIIIKKISGAKTQINVVSSTISSADELAKFKKLLDDGVITQEEFDKKKQQLLNA